MSDPSTPPPPAAPPPVVTPGIARLMTLEHLVLGLAAVAGFAATGTSWWLFAALILAPDLSMLGYLAGPRAGAAAYNAVHSWIGPAVLGIVALLIAAPVLMAIALVWAAHIAFDRALGYGLKLPGGFRETHLGRIGGG